MAAANFDACLAFTLRYEGGYVDHPADPGGATNLGITQRTLAAWRKHAVTKDEVRALTRAEAAMIYRRQYWTACQCDALPAGVDLAVFDYAVNSGPARAVKALQKAVRVETDGQVGAHTLDAMTGRDPRVVIQSVCAERLAFVKRLATFRTFGKGWTARISAVRTVAGRMIGHTATPLDVETPEPEGDTGKAREDDTLAAAKPGFWEKLGTAGGVLATVVGAVTDWKVAAVIIGGAVALYIVNRAFTREDRE